MEKYHVLKTPVVLTANATIGQGVNGAGGLASNNMFGVVVYKDRVIGEQADCQLDGVADVLVTYSTTPPVKGASLKVSSGNFVEASAGDDAEAILLDTVTASGQLAKAFLKRHKIPTP